MLIKLLMKSMSVDVTLRYAIFFFWSIWGYFLFDGNSKLNGETNLFVKGFNHFVGLFLTANVSLLLGSYITTRQWQFSPDSYDSVPTKPTFRVSKWVKIENIQWGLWNNSLNWRKGFKCLYFIWQTWYLKYKLFTWCFCPWVFSVAMETKIIFLNIYYN